MIVQDEFYTIEQVANKLRCNTRYVGDKIRSGKLKAHKKGKRYYVFHSDLVSFIKGE